MFMAKIGDRIKINPDSIDFNFLKEALTEDTIDEFLKSNHIVTDLDYRGYANYTVVTFKDSKILLLDREFDICPKFKVTYG